MELPDIVPLERTEMMGLMAVALHSIRKCKVMKDEYCDI